MGLDETEHVQATSGVVAGLADRIGQSSGIVPRWECIGHDPRAQQACEEQQTPWPAFPSSAGTLPVGLAVSTASRIQASAFRAILSW